METVQNKERKPTENEVYVYVTVKELDTGKKHKCLFTQIELSDMEKVQAGWLHLKNNILYPAVIAKKSTWLWHNEKLDHIFRLSESQLKKAVERAERNPEDIPKETWIQKLIEFLGY